MIRLTSSTPTTLAILMVGCLATAAPVLRAASPQGPNVRDASVARGAKPVRIMKVVPIGDLLRRSESPARLPFSTFLASPDEDSSERSLFDSNSVGNSGFRGDQIVELILDLAPRNLEDASIEWTGNNLLLSGPPDTVTMIENVVRRVRTSLIRDVRLEARAIRLGADAGDVPAVLTAPQLEALSGKGQLVWSARANCRSGHVVRLGRTKRTPYVYDYDVEVAQKATISDPKVGRTFEGFELSVQSHALTGSTDSVLLGQFAFGSQVGKTRLLPTGVEDMASLDAPTMRMNTGTFAGRVATGGALAITVRGADGSRIAITVQATGAKETSPPTDRVAFPISALLSPNPLVLIPEENEFASQSPLKASQLRSVVGRALGLDLGSEVDVMSGFMVVPAPEDRDGVAKLLAELQSTWLQTAGITARTLLANGTEHYAVTVPTLLGRKIMVRHGTETTAIRDADVEIAQKATAVNPVIERLFSGVRLSGTAFPAGSETNLEGNLAIRLIETGEPTRRPAENDKSADLYFATSTSSSLDHHGASPVGQELDLGAGPGILVDGQVMASRQVLRITLF